MTTPKTGRPKFWEEFRPESPNAGADLARLRKGLGQKPGAVPDMWPYHRVYVPDAIAARGGLTSSFAAEHAALSLFGLHQQSQRRHMHAAEVSLGQALRRLNVSPKYSAEAVDRRVTSAATSSSPAELVGHLRGLITLLRGIEQPVDYGMLMADIIAWGHPDSRNRALRRWGQHYYAWSPTDTTTESAK